MIVLMNMKLKKILPLCLVVPLLVGTFSENKAYAMRVADEFEPSLLFKLDFNQNNFLDEVSQKAFSPANPTGSFQDGIRYNSYRLNQDKITIPFSSFKGDQESTLTTSFWVFPESVSGIQKILTVGSHSLSYDGNLKEWQIHNGSTLVSKVNDSLIGNKWTHISLQLSKSSSTPQLWVNGAKLSLSASTPSSPSWTSSSVLEVDGSHLSSGSRVDELEIRKGTLPDDLVSEISGLASIPDLRGEVISGNPHLSWSSEILPENVLLETSLEKEQMVPNLMWGWDKSTNGGQSIVSGDAYSGERLEKIDNTVMNGNLYNYPETSSNSSISSWKRFFVSNATNLSVTYYAKADGQNATVTQSGDGGWAESFSSKPVIKLTQPVKKGERTLYVDDARNYSQGQYLGFDTSPTVILPQRVVESVDYTKNTITLLSPMDVDYPAGSEIRNRPWRGAFHFGARTVTADSKWQRLSQNTQVYNSLDYDVSKRGASFYTYFTTGGTLHFDNLKLGYATKTKLYRDDKLLYEGYLSDYRDTSSKDMSAPKMIGKTTVTRTQNNIDVSFAPAKDVGTDYSYRIQAVANDGKTTPLSKSVNVNVMSGIKGYAYVFDKYPISNPTVLNTTGTTLSTSINDAEDRYLHIRAIDNNGNLGEVKHIRISSPELTVTPDVNGTHAQLDWKMKLDDELYEYKVYKRKKGQTEFQSVSTFNQDGDKQLRILNLYPKVNRYNGGSVAIPTQTFTTWKGETKTLPKSASLEKWMEEPNSENAKGYGKGLIDVVSVDYDTFNANPLEFLKKNGTEWNFDTVFFGTWDANAYNPDFSDMGYNLVSSFVGDGNGLLVGHDVVRFNYSVGGFERLKNLLNIGIFADVGTTPAQANWSTSGKLVRLTKSGLMTKYPWNIGEIGSKLSIPATHTLSQITYGDVWIDFANEPSQTDSSGKGQGNFYLTTWNNTGMIQTGHSNGEATPDEQKVLANTLFYLSQKTTKTSIKDYSSVDDALPNLIGETNVSLKTRGVYTLSFSPVLDNGTSYEYYVEAIGKETGSRYLSSIVGGTVLSGMKGYSLEMSNQSVPNLSTNETNQTSLEFTPPSFDKFYLHVKAVDNAGNQSVKTLSYDNQIAKLIVTPTMSAWTNGTVNLNVKSNQGLGKVVEIRLPDGTVVSGDMTSYNVDKNGMYVFYGKDVFGQWVMGSYLVNTIDKEKPIVNVDGLPTDWANEDVPVDIRAK